MSPAGITGCPNVVVSFGEDPEYCPVNVCEGLNGEHILELLIEDVLDETLTIRPHCRWLSRRGPVSCDTGEEQVFGRWHMFFLVDKVLLIGGPFDDFQDFGLDYAARYEMDLVDFDCHGSNVFTLVDDGSGCGNILGTEPCCETFPSTITVSPVDPCPATPVQDEDMMRHCCPPQNGASTDNGYHNKCWEFACAGVGTVDTGGVCAGSTCTNWNSTFALLSGLVSPYGGALDQPCSFYAVNSNAGWTMELHSADEDCGQWQLTARVWNGSSFGITPFAIYVANISDWDCRGPNVLTRQFFNGCCNGWPATITITPVTCP